jgi:hypothetical protein
MAKLNELLIYHHLGLGDHIICNAIVRHFHEKYGPLSLFVKKHNLASVRALYKDIEVNLIQVNNDRDCYSFFNDFNVIKIGFEKTVFPNWEKSFYDQLGSDYSLRFSKFYIERDYEREALLEQKLKLPNEFAFCNNSCSSGNLDFKFNTNLKKIMLSAMTDSIFDWIGVLEKAAELHTLDSSVFQLAKQLNLKSNKYFYNSRSLDATRQAFNFDNQSWKVINLK